MKKILVVVLSLLMVFSSVAFAASDCSLCGRAHAGAFCPEECLNDCSQMSQHKWYDCPDRVITSCWYCGDKSGLHNENTCPVGDIVWNDVLGTFKTAAYANLEGTRRAEYCSFCAHYGYHSDIECLKNPNRIEPTPVVTTNPTPIATVAPTATPAITEEPAIELVCRHSWRYDRAMQYQEFGGKDYCVYTVYLTKPVCNNCGEKGRAVEEIETEPHVMRNGRCVNCDYKDGSYVAPTVAATATPVSTKRPNKTDSCVHEWKLFSDVIDETTATITYANQYICTKCWYRGEYFETTELVEQVQETSAPSNITQGTQQTVVVENNDFEWSWSTCVIAVLATLLALSGWKIYKDSQARNKEERREEEPEEESEEVSMKADEVDGEAL